MLAMPQKNLVLASQSPTRAGLLTAAGLRFETRAARIDEQAIREAGSAEGMDGLALATMLAEAKAAKVAAMIDAEGHDGAGGNTVMILASDQLLECDGVWHGKPDNAEQARATLAALAGKTHRLITVAVIYMHGGRVWHAAEIPEVAIRAMSDGEIAEYIAALAPETLTASGIYQIEGAGARILARVQGCPYAVLGLPLLHVMAYLREHGLCEEDG